MGPAVKGNPLHISVYLLIASYIFGELIFPKYPLIYLINLIGLILIIIAPIIFFSSRNVFYAYEENPLPQTNTNNISKRAEKLLIDFSTNGGVIHVSEGSFITYGVNQNNSKDVLINIHNINWSYPKQLIQVSSGADLVFSY